MRKSRFSHGRCVWESKRPDPQAARPTTDVQPFGASYAQNNKMSDFINAASRPMIFIWRFMSPLFCRCEPGGIQGIS
jgi:hypothetical protein